MWLLTVFAPLFCVVTSIRRTGHIRWYLKYAFASALMVQMSMHGNVRLPSSGTPFLFNLFSPQDSNPLHHIGNALVSPIHVSNKRAQVLSTILIIDMIRRNDLNIFGFQFLLFLHIRRKAHPYHNHDHWFVKMWSYKVNSCYANTIIFLHFILL